MIDEQQTDLMLGFDLCWITNKYFYSVVYIRIIEQNKYLQILCTVKFVLETKNIWADWYFSNKNYQWMKLKY
jgi:hypothetical protein